MTYKLGPSPLVKYWKLYRPLCYWNPKTITRKCDNEPQGTLVSLFGPILFLSHQSNVIDHSWPITMDHICKNKKPCLYVHKKASAKLSRPSNFSLGKWKCISFIFVFYPFSFTRERYRHTAVAVNSYYKCRFFNVHQSLLSPSVIRISIIMKIIWFTLEQFGWLESKPKSENNSWRL